jgi:flagellar basal-body rod protein FlgC
MSDLLSAMTASASGLDAHASRLRLISENIANADTPGYHRKLVSFEQVLDSRDSRVVRTGALHLDQTELEEIFDPNHPLANEQGTYEGSNVNILIEIADAQEAQRSYEANLKMFDQARQMKAALLDLLRR